MALRNVRAPLLRRRRSKELSCRIRLFGGEVSRQYNHKLNKQRAAVRCVVVHGHALVINCHDEARLCDAGALEWYCVAVQVLQLVLKANECLEERDRFLHVEVVALAREPVVGDGLEREYQVAGSDIRALVALALEGNLLAVGHATLDRECDNVAALLDLLSLAEWALAADNLALAAALGALRLHLLHKSWRDLVGGDLDAPATALVARDNVIRTPCTGAPALGAEYLTICLNRQRLSEVEILESDFDLKMDVRSLALLLLLTAAKKVAKHAAEGVHAATSILLLLESVLAVLVVYPTLLLIGKHLIGLCNFLEHGIGSLVAGVLVGMVFFGKVAVVLANLPVTRIPGHAEHSIVVLPRKCKRYAGERNAHHEQHACAHCTPKDVHLQSE
eukprot:Opistho-2@20426